MIAGEAVDFDDVRAAADRLRGVAHRTPVLTSRTLDERFGATVFLKAENFQRIGAFKFRGAYNAISRLSEAQRKGGVVAFSSGNHAQGVALAAKLLGVPAVIIMPADAPQAKLDATAGYGAEVITYDRVRMNRAELAMSIAAERGATLIPPYDHPHIIAGAGTVALELIDEVGPLDAMLVCLGGGGLFSGCCIAATHLSPGIAMYGVEPQAGDDWVQSLRENRIVSIPVPQTIADGQQTQAPGELTWPIVRRLAAGVVTVSDDEIRSAMHFAFERLKIVLEPSGACALAAVLYAKADLAGKRVGLTLSGGNVSPQIYGSAIVTHT